MKLIAWNRFLWCAPHRGCPSFFALNQDRRLTISVTNACAHWLWFIKVMDLWCEVFSLALLRVCN